MTPRFDIHTHGVEIKENLIPHDLIQAVIAEMDASYEKLPKHGIRNAEKKFSSVLNVVTHKELVNEARNILGKEPQIVRVIFFDKTPDKNWLVTWHQDKTVALNDRKEIEGWGPWTLKDKTHHVQPPRSVLNQMVTFRVHLDPAGNKSGCLKIIPCSHERGILKQSEINEIVKNTEPVFCVVKSGDTVVMRPHILHSSSKSITSEHRRVIHIEFSSYELPNGISWA